MSELNLNLANLEKLIAAANEVEDTDEPEGGIFYFRDGKYVTKEEFYAGFKTKWVSKYYDPSNI